MRVLTARALNSIQSWAVTRPGWRLLLLRRLGVTHGEKCIVRESCFFGGGTLRLGRGVFVNRDSFFDGASAIDIGDFSRIGTHVRIVTAGHNLRHSDVRRWPQDGLLDMPVRIGRGCWLATGVTVLPGVTIADGCVVAAGAVVTRDTAPHGLYAGVPARRIRDLPIDEQFVEPN